MKRMGDKWPCEGFKIRVPYEKISFAAASVLYQDVLEGEEKEKFLRDYCKINHTTPEVIKESWKEPEHPFLKKEFITGRKTCETCKWRSDDFTSVCVNGDSDRRADFVSEDDTCERWEKKND